MENKVLTEEDVYGKKYDLEGALLRNGFILDYENDSRSTYCKGFYLSILWADPFILDENGVPNGMVIHNPSSSYENRYLYKGVRPENDQELEELLNRFF